VRYSVPGIPAQFSATAFTPNIVRQAAGGAQQFKSALTGQPGTQAIAAPYPEGVSQDPTYVSISESRAMPPWWYPQLYYQRGLTNLPPVAIYSDNCLPIPAVNPRGRSAVLAGRRKVGGRKPVKALPIVANWTGG
jgi:hypothetical protein